jgi:hypothetical protein
LPSNYTAATAQFLIYKNDALVTVIQTDKSGSPTTTIARGYHFDQGAAYSVQVVLNYGYRSVIWGQKVPLMLVNFMVELVDGAGKTVTTEQIGKDENFVSWKPLSVKYKLTLNGASIPSSDYSWSFTPATAKATGHAFLGTIDQDKITLNDDSTANTLTFSPSLLATGETITGSNIKAAPLALNMV